MAEIVLLGHVVYFLAADGARRGTRAELGSQASVQERLWWFRSVGQELANWTQLTRPWRRAGARLCERSWSKATQGEALAWWGSREGERW